MRDLGNPDRREMGQHLNNRVVNSHLPFRRRERAMLRFRQMKSLQKFVSVHDRLHNHSNAEGHLVDRDTFKERHSAALAEWQHLAGLAAWSMTKLGLEESGPYRTGSSVRSKNGWFAARPSGTEDIYKICAESFIGFDHLARIQREAQDLISGIFDKADGAKV